jgi:allantoin racemase
LSEAKSKYRFLLIQAFSLPPGARYRMRQMQGSKEGMLMNYGDYAHLLQDVDWEVHPGAPAPHGDWPVETREEFCLVGASRLPVVRAACASGKHNAIVLLGGGDPGYAESREIGRRYGIPVSSCAHAQMHVATQLGNRFSIIDIAESHNMRMQDLVVQYRFAGHCASIRNIDFPLPRPPYTDDRPIQEQQEKAERGERSEMLEAAVEQSLVAIEEDGAEVLMLGCSAAFWMRPLLQQRLTALGWEVPVLEGYRCAIEQAKLLVNLGVDASGLAFPIDHPKKWRRKKLC